MKLSDCENPRDRNRDLAWRTAEPMEQCLPDACHADFRVLMINPALQEGVRHTTVVTPAHWTAEIVEVSDPLDGLVRASELQADLLVIDLDTPTFNIGEVLCAVKRSTHFNQQIALAVTTDLEADDIPGLATWPHGVLVLRRSDWLAALASR